MIQKLVITGEYFVSGVSLSVDVHFLSTSPLRDTPLSRLRLVLTSFLGLNANNYALYKSALNKGGGPRNAVVGSDRRSV